MYFDDLVPYAYDPSYEYASMLSIGWLDGEHPFPTAEPSADFVAALWRFCCSPAIQHRGFQVCELCDRPRGFLRCTHEGEARHLGSAVIYVFDHEGRAFAAPDLVFHYVTEHHYAPPSVFVEAVLTGPVPGSAAYEEGLEKHRGTRRKRSKTS